MLSNMPGKAVTHDLSNFEKYLVDSANGNVAVNIKIINMDKL